MIYAWRIPMLIQGLAWSSGWTCSKILCWQTLCSQISCSLWLGLLCKTLTEQIFPIKWAFQHHKCLSPTTYSSMLIGYLRKCSNLIKFQSYHLQWTHWDPLFSRNSWMTWLSSQGKIWLLGLYPLVKFCSLKPLSEVTISFISSKHLIQLINSL